MEEYKIYILCTIGLTICIGFKYYDKSVKEEKNISRWELLVRRKIISQRWDKIRKFVWEYVKNNKKIQKPEPEDWFLIKMSFLKKLKLK